MGGDAGRRRRHLGILNLRRAAGPQLLSGAARSPLNTARPGTGTSGPSFYAGLPADQFFSLQDVSKFL